MNIIKGTIESKIIKLSQPDSIKFIQDRETLVITGGEFAITYDHDDLPISTLLGSCVAVMLYDDVIRVKGMNHFLLPDACSQKVSCHYGLHAMETMLNEMYKLGCRKENIVAKIAGGATILQGLSDNIGMRNVMFARSFCRSEGLRVVSESVLGTSGRVVMLDNEFKTVTKSIANRMIDEKLAQADRTLAQTINKVDKVISDDTIFF